MELTKREIALIKAMREAEIFPDVMIVWFVSGKKKGIEAVEKVYGKDDYYHQEVKQVKTLEDTFKAILEEEDEIIYL